MMGSCYLDLVLASGVSLALSKADVERIAALAHVELTEDDKALFARQLADILAYAQHIEKIDTTGVPPTSHVLASHPALRSDEIRSSLSRPDALANAPEAAVDAGLFKVPKVIG